MLQNGAREGVPRLAPTLCLHLFLAASSAACGSDGSPLAEPTVRDSAGVQIVENENFLWPDGSGWKLSEQPELDIGLLEGDPNYQFFQIAGTQKLSDGRIAVANAGTYQLRLYDENGQFLGATGREGGGPGEFGGMTQLRTTEGDSLLIYDWRNRRISVIDPEGGFARSVQLQFLTDIGGFPVHIEAFSGGSMLLGVQQFFSGGEIQSGLRRDTMLYLHCDREGGVIDTAGALPGSEVLVRAQDNMVMAGTRTFGLMSQQAVYADGFYYSGTDSYQILYFGSDGQLRRVIRRSLPNMQVTDEDIERHKQERLENADTEEDRRVAERLLEEMPFPESFPAHGSFVVDAEGNLWVADYRRPGDDQPRWTVFDAEGAMLGVVETPERFTIHQIGPDFVLGSWADEMDVEHVRLYRLIK